MRVRTGRTAVAWCLLYVPIEPDEKLMPQTLATFSASAEDDQTQYLLALGKVTGSTVGRKKASPLQ